MKINKLYIRILTVMTLLSATALEAEADGRKLSYNDNRRFDYFFLEAVNQQAAGNMSAAFDLFTHALEIKPDAPEVYFNLAGYYVTLRNDSLSKANFEKAAELAPKNTTYIEHLGQFYINAKDYKNAIKAYEKLYALQHDNPNVITILLQLYGTQNDYSRMIEMLDRLETVQGSSDRISMTKLQVYEQQGKKKEQEDLLKGMVAKYPNDPSYVVMFCNWLMNNGRTKEAGKRLQQVLKENPTDVGARLTMLDFYSATGKKEKEKDLAEQLMTEKDVPSKTKLALLRQTIIDYDKTDSTAVERLFDKILATPQKDGDMYMMKAAYMALHKQPTEAIDTVYQQALKVEPDNSRARLLLLQDIWPTKNYDRVIEVAHPGQEYNPDDMAFYYFEGLAHYMKKDNDKTLETFKKAVEQINKDSDPDIVTDLYSVMGDIYHAKGQDSLAFQSYEKSLQWKPDNVGALNNYAYYLSERNEDLEKAEQMSRKTIDAEPKNSTFLDTYAWILFQQGKYADAKTYIDQAIENDSTLGDVVLEHAGDIYYMSGEKEKALDFWTKAAEKGEGSGLLSKKIKLKRIVTK